MEITAMEIIMDITIQQVQQVPVHLQAQHCPEGTIITMEEAITDSAGLEIGRPETEEEVHLT